MNNNNNNNSTPKNPPSTGKRRGRKRKCETPIVLPQIGETDNLRITNETPEYCTTPVLFGDVMIFSKKEIVNNIKPVTSVPLLPLLNTKPTQSHIGTGGVVVEKPVRRHTANNNIFISHTRPSLRPLLPTTQPGLGSNINFKTNMTVEKGVPLKTDAACFWDCHPFDWPPLCLPVEFDEKRNRFKVTGNFCSWNCMKAFNNKSNSVNKFRQHQYIHDLFRKIVLDKNEKPFPYKHIPLAASRWSLKLFGGTKTIEEFRKDCVLLNETGAVRLERTTLLCVQPIEPAKNFTQ